MRALFLLLSLVFAFTATGCSSPADAGTYTFVRARQTFGDFAPSDIAGLALWLDGSNAGSLTITSAPDVDQWDDLSGAGNHVSQGTAAKKPHTGGGLGGKNAIVFDGSDDLLANLTAGGTFTGSSGYLFIVLRRNAMGGSQYVFGSADHATGNSYALQIWLQEATLGGVATTAIRQRNNDPDQDLVEGDTVLTAAPTDYVLSYYSTGSAYGIQVNGAAESLNVVDGLNTGHWFSDTTLRDSFTVGAAKFNSEAAHCTVEIGELVYYDGVVLTAGQITSVESYLNTKWAVY